MARKSRKTQAQNKPVAEVKKEAAALPTAIYARLSVENSGKDDDGNSLQNQIAVCKDYLEGCPWLRLTEVYSDNGKTGTVFDHPAWNRLMEDVRTGKIQCIVVRDLSRFGRDYVETIREVAAGYAAEIMRRLREHEYDPQTMRLWVVGGGGCLLRHFGEFDRDRVTIIDNIYANAEGYE